MSSHREYSSIPDIDLPINVSNTSTVHLTKLDQMLVVVYPCMIVTGVICNTLIFVIMRRQRMSHISTCYYMKILAVVDTIVLLLGLSNIWLYLLNPKWLLLSQSANACKIISVILYAASDTSEWIRCLMSVDRCIAVTRPLHASSICTVRRAKIFLCILVLSMLLINIHFLFTHYLSVDDGCTPYERYEFFIFRVWSWIDATVYGFLPFLLLLTANLIIIYSIFRAHRSTSALQKHQSRRNQDKNKSSTSVSVKLTRMLLVVTFFSVFASFPSVCLGIYTGLRPDDVSSFIQHYIRPLSLMLQFTNHYINFFLYAMAGKAFRDELKQLFRDIAVKMYLTESGRNTRINRRLMRNNAEISTHGYYI